ncbi:enoyl-CoA hydratase-related protein [Glycomyces xiaoerkulensis]|uniref:enoyl-CoA hydratase-related protein n=1 Tax=Glycomyces xiaoerkulensis TaxID=2038139 RepID=UPI0018E46AA9|nr:enoyl-CoA hydratase-related protein [Glycomyces xiaoerkulensis]
MEPTDAPIAYRADRGVATITLNEPDRRNALSTALIARLRESLVRATADESVRVVVLDHAGPVFCSGADLTESAAATGAADLPATRLAEALADMAEAPKPIVAVAGGAVRGGGLGLLAAADLAICRTGTTLAFSEVRLGVVPAVIAPVVARRLSPARMGELFLTGRTFGAEEAAAWGLADAVAEDAAAETERAVGRLKRGGPSALAGVKELTGDPGLRRRLKEAAATTARYFFAPEGREGVQSFLEKDSPHWVD